MRSSRLLAVSAARLMNSWYVSSASGASGARQQVAVRARGARPKQCISARACLVDPPREACVRRLDDILGVKAVQGRLGRGARRRERTLLARRARWLPSTQCRRARALTMASCGSTGTTFSVWLDTGPPHFGQPSQWSRTASACWSPVRRCKQRAKRGASANKASATPQAPSRGTARAAPRQQSGAPGGAEASETRQQRPGHAQKQWPHGATDKVPLSGSQQKLHLDIPGREGKSSSAPAEQRLAESPTSFAAALRNCSGARERLDASRSTTRELRTPEHCGGQLPRKRGSSLRACNACRCALALRSSAL